LVNNILEQRDIIMMNLTGPQIRFENRHDAGRKLAAELDDYSNRSAIVLAIPNGGVPVALEVASAINAELDIIVCRKIPIPLTPEGGFGAIADDGTTVLNDAAVKRTGLNKQQIDYEAGKVRSEIKQRSILYKGDRPLVRINGRTVIVIDDGVASGITMLAAVASARHRHPREVVVAVPAAPAHAVSRLEEVADRVVTCAMANVLRFRISDYYHYWHDLSDSEVIRYLNQWRMRHLFKTELPKTAEESGGEKLASG
jgi:predicted phosphoribosyltransferase